MLQYTDTGLEGMVNSEQWIFNGISGNAFSSARVLAGFLNEDDFPEMETSGVAHIGVSEQVAGFGSMLDAA